MLFREAVDIKRVALILALLLVSSFAYALNLDLQIAPVWKEFTDEEDVLLDVNIVSYEVFSDAEDTRLVVKVGDQNIVRDIGVVKPDEVKKTQIELGKFPAGNYFAEAFLEYDFLGIIDQTQTEYFNIKVVPSTPIVMETYKAIIKEIIVPADTEVNKEFEIKVKILNKLEELQVEFLVGEEKSTQTVTELGDVEVSKKIKTENEGLLPLEVRLLSKGVVQNSRIMNLVIANPENYQKVDFVRLEYKKGEVKIETGKKPQNVIEEIGCFVVGGCQGDFAGPEIKNLTVTSNQEKIKFEFTADDTQTGNSKISACYIDLTGEWTSIPGTYDSPTVNLVYEIESFSGTKAVNFQCVDEWGNTGFAAYNVEGKVDVLIISNENKLKKDSALEGAINQYISALSRDGLSARYLDLASSKIGEYGLTINDFSDWKEIKKAVDKLSTKFEAKYVLILGGADIVPIPPAQTTEEIPTIPVSDDTYADLEFDGLPNIVVNRIPSPVNGDQKIITTALLSAVKQHTSNGVNFNQNFISADVCIWPPHCAGTRDVGLLAQTFFNSECDESERCLSVPPNCLGLNCTAPEKFKENLLANEVIHIIAHGSGYSYAAHAADNQWYTVLNGSDLYSIHLDKNPLVTSIACHGGVIDCDSGKGCITKDGTGFALLANGASVYVANSRYGYGGISSSLINQFYDKLIAGKTVGEAMMETKRENLKQANSEWTKAVIYELQFYGDPTLKITR